jgi:hypothetical protein
MNRYQKSVSIAFLIVGAELALKHGWFNKALSWLHAPVTGKASSMTAAPLADWQAAVFLYIAFIVLGEWPATGSIAQLLAWGLAIVDAPAAFSTAKAQGYLPASTKTTAAPAATNPVPNPTAASITSAAAAGNINP